MVLFKLPRTFFPTRKYTVPLGTIYFSSNFEKLLWIVSSSDLSFIWSLMGRYLQPPERCKFNPTVGDTFTRNPTSRNFISRCYFEGQCESRSEVDWCLIDLLSL
ncbi:hypothetical protein TNCV_4917441 [Trichonephila clavipes]|nr:hypothetical protein TNCV_4917441 [Trichonephila clavipes]